MIMQAVHFGICECPVLRLEGIVLTRNQGNEKSGAFFFDITVVLGLRITLHILRAVA